MYIYRAEKFKDPNYLEKARKEHKRAIELDLTYHRQELEEAKKEREKLLVSKKEAIISYDTLVNKPISELTDEERKKIITMANGYYKVVGSSPIETNETIKDSDIEIARSTISIFAKSPLHDADWAIDYCSKRIAALESNESNIHCIGLDRDSVTRENIDALKKHILELKKAGAEVHVAVDGNMHTKSNDSQTDYLYTKEEIELLNELDSFLMENDMKPIKICEVGRVDSLEDFDKGWTLQQVATANNKIDSIVERIKENNLSPFEAMLYIHKLASTFKYNDGGLSETPRVLPSILNSDKIVCSGYATFVKAIVDKLNMPGLKCDLVGCSIYKGNKINGHTHNLVTIKDPKYDIDGSYVEDACFDSKKGEYEKGRGFGHCLYPINDVMNFNNGTGYYNPGYPDRFSNLLMDSRGFVEGMKQIGNKNIFTKLIYNMKQHFKYRQTPVLVEKYGNNSTPIPLETYRKGLIALYSTVYDDPKKVEELVDQQIHNSIVNSIVTFNPDADNAFSSSVSKDQRKKLQKNTTGPSAVQ